MMKQTRWSAVRWMWPLLVVLTAVAGCGDDEGEAAGSTTTAGAATSEGSELEPLEITVATFGIDIAGAQVYIPYTLGYYEDENLEVTLVPGAANVTNLLVAGQAELGYLGGATAMNLAAEGQDFQLIYANSAAFGAASVISQNDIGDISQCERVGALQPGSSTYGGAVLHSKANDLDFDIVPLADWPTVLAGVASGNLDCGVGTKTAFAAAIEDGQVNLLIDTTDVDVLEESGLNPNLPDGTFFGVRSTMEENREAITRFLRAVNRGFEWMESATDEELADAVLENGDFSGTDRQTMIANVPNYRAIWARTTPQGMIEEADWPEALEYYRSFGLENIDPESDLYTYDKRVDMSYLLDGEVEQE